MGWENFNHTPYNELQPHLKTGTSCVGCHMPYIRQGSVKVSDHWVRSPLNNPNQSCQTCHNRPSKELKERVLNIQHKTDELLIQSQETVGLSMIRLQIRLCGPYFSSFFAHSYSYEPSNELKSVLKHPNFRFGPYSPTGS